MDCQFCTLWLRWFQLWFCFVGWDKAKQYTRSHCDYSFTGLQANVVPALESASTDTIRKYYRKAREYMKAYREGITDDVEVIKALKTYKLHCQVYGLVD